MSNKKKFKSVFKSSTVLTGRHVLEFKERISATNDDMCAALGITTLAWAKLISEDIDKPIANLTIAALLKRYDKNIDHWPFPINDSWDEFLELIANILFINEIDKPKVAALLGRQKTNGYRWNVDPEAASRSIKILIPILIADLKKGSLTELKAYINDLLNAAKAVENHDVYNELMKFKRDFINNSTTNPD